MTPMVFFQFADRRDTELGLGLGLGLGNRNSAN